MSRPLAASVICPDFGDLHFTKTPKMAFKTKLKSRMGRRRVYLYSCSRLRIEVLNGNE